MIVESVATKKGDDRSVSVAACRITEPERQEFRNTGPSLPDTPRAESPISYQNKVKLTTSAIGSQEHSGE